MTPSAPRPPNHVEYQGESSAPRKSTITEIPIRRQLDPETLILTFDEIDVTNLDEATQIEKIVEGGDNVDEDEFMDEIFNSQEDLDTRDALIRKKGKGIVEIKDTPPPTPIRSPRTHIASLSSDKEKLQELTVSDHTHSSSKPRTSSTPKPKPCRVKKDFKAITEGVHVTLKVAIVYTRDHEDHHDDNARPEGESSVKRQRTFEFGNYTIGKSSSSLVMDESTSSGSGTQEDLEDFDAWLNKQGIDDDEVPTKEVSPELLVEVSKREMTFNDTQRIQNAVNIMMRDRCNSGEEHQYHLD
ncbi:hypothetical protein Tco_0561088 [Tanacetum coccineum]